MKTTPICSPTLRAARGALALLAFGAATCGAGSLAGSGKPVTEERAVSGFSGLSVSLPARVEVVQGSVEGLRITADDNVLPEIESVVEGGRLKLRLRRGVDLHGKMAIRIQVSAKRIDSISVAGTGDVSAPALTSERLAISVAGSGDVRVGGRATTLQVSISGSGDVDAAKLEAQDARVSIAGSGDAVVWARKGLNVSIAGSGDVRYFGDPDVRRSVMGSGSIRRAGAAPS